MEHLFEVLVGVGIIIIAGALSALARMLVRMRDDMHHVKYELSLNGKQDTLKDRVVLMQMQVHEIQTTLARHIEEPS